MKIEHWCAQSTHPELQLTWSNLFGVCKGNEGYHPRHQHCDTHKRNCSLTVNPLEELEQHIFYRTDGEIGSTRAEIQTDLADVLNLNIETLKRRRKAVWDGIYEGLKRKEQKGKKGFTEGVLRRAIDKLRQKNSEGKYGEFCQVPIFWLEKKLRSK